MSESPVTTLLEDAVDIPAWLETDGQLPLIERSRRDREIGLKLGAGNNTARVRGWWQRMDRHGDTATGKHLHRVRTWINLALVLIGLIGGIGVALAAFHYDGTDPVNVVWLLWLLVAPQLILLILNLLLIPGRLPGLRAVQDALAAFNPGALAAAICRQLTRNGESPVFTWTAARTSAARRFGKWQMLYWSQIAAVAFNTGVIATAAVLVAFTDLAFGWSTTLAVDSETAAGIFRTIAAPWAGVLVDSVPSDSLVERSQFFRLEGDSELPDSRVLSAWWSFSLLAIITYGLLPRLVFLGFAGWRLRQATRNLLMSDSKVAALIDRMATPDLQTRALAENGQAPVQAPTAGAVTRAALAGTASAVIWNQCVTGDRAAELIGMRIGLAVTTLLNAGGAALPDERQTLDRLLGSRDPVVVLVPAWEPPLLEFIDLLGTLRSRIGATPSIIVIPVAEDSSATSSIERENWSRAVGKTGDPRAYIETGDA